MRANFATGDNKGNGITGSAQRNSILEEVRYYHDRYAVDFVGITDDNFMVLPERIATLPSVLGPFIKESGIRWGTHGRLDEAADLRPDARTGRCKKNAICRLEHMAEAGCVYIGFGAESASPDVLQSMGKGGFICPNGVSDINGYDVPVTMVEGIKRCWEHGIHANCTWIMGYPGESLEQLKASVAFIGWQYECAIQDTPPGSVRRKRAEASVNQQLFTATAYPGTEMFKHPTVKAKLEDVFGIRFGPNSQPIVDEALHDYVLELDDATKLLKKSERPLNFSAMSDEQFSAARKLADSGVF